MSTRKPTTVYLDPQAYEALRALAEEEQRSVSRMAEVLIRRALARGAQSPSVVLPHESTMGDGGRETSWPEVVVVRDVSGAGMLAVLTGEDDPDAVSLRSRSNSPEGEVGQ